MVDRRASGFRSMPLRERLARYAVTVGAATAAQGAGALPIDSFPGVTVGAGATSQLLLDADGDGVNDLRLYWSVASTYPVEWRGFFIAPARPGVAVRQGPVQVTSGPAPFRNALYAAYYPTSYSVSASLLFSPSRAVLWGRRIRNATADEGGLRGETILSSMTFGYFVATDGPQFAAFRLQSDAGAAGVGFVQLRHTLANEEQITVEAVRFTFDPGALHVTALSAGAAPVPEPRSLALLAAGAAGLAYLRRRQRHPASSSG